MSNGALKREAPRDGDSSGEPPAKKQAGPQSFTVTVLLPIDAVGLIIGKGGSVLKMLNEETGAKVRVQEYADIAQGSKQRGVLVTGTPEAIEAVEREILGHLKQRRVTHDMHKAADREEGAADEAGARHTSRWLIPAELSGLLIGKRGMGIIAINQESGAHVKIAHEQEMAPGSPDKLVYITGSEEQCAKALELIRGKVGGKAVEGDGGHYVLVHTRAIGFLLGKGGAELKRMCEASGARIQLASPAELEMGSVDIRVRLTGTEEQVNKARALIRERMEAWHKDHPQPTDPAAADTSVKLAVPAAAVSGLIGKQGAGVKEVNAKSGASVKFLSDQKSHDATHDMKPILLTGPLNNVFKAQRLLLERLLALPASVREPPSRPSQPRANAAAAGGGAGARKAPGVVTAGILDAASGLGMQPLFPQANSSGQGGLYSLPGLLGDYQPPT